MADALALGASGAIRGGSSPLPSTANKLNEKMSIRPTSFETYHNVLCLDKRCRFFV